MTTSLRTVTGTLPPDVADAVRTLARTVEEHDGIEALGEESLLRLGGHDADAGTDTHAGTDAGTDTVHVLVETPSSSLVGYAQLDVRPDGVTGELAVSPDHRRRGIGTTLLGAAQEHARSARAPLRVWAHGDLPPARGLAERAGLTVRRELWQMALDLPPDPDDLPPGEVPEGVTVRPFVVGQDEEAWLAVNARAFADHPEQGRITLADLRARQREPWFDADDLLLAERDGRLLASTWMKVEPGSDTGELYVLGVDPDAQGQGLGRLLTARTLHHLARRGLRRVVLYTEADNTGAVRTYAAVGFTTSRSDVQYG